MNDIQKPIFWRDDRMPYVELRKVTDGRAVCYEPHTHTQWSAGAITGGESTFVCGDRKYEVRQGALVFINPDCVHACNPIDQRPWAYLMLYLDTDWLARLRYEAGFLEAAVWQDFPRDVLRDSALFNGFTQLADCLLDANTALLDKQTRLIQLMYLGADGAGTVPETMKVLPGLGTVVVFLSEEFPHEVLPARRDRYSIAGWYRVNPLPGRLGIRHA